MKFNIINLLFSVAVVTSFILIQSCNNSPEQHHEGAQDHEEIQDHEGQDHDSHGVGSHGHESLTEERLTLNNGSKWEADEPTNRNAEKIIAIADHFLEINDKNLQAYQAFGEDITEALNTMIRECTMEGEADQALHLWFFPLLQHAETLQNATGTDGLDEIAVKMIDRINMYSGYFE